MSELSVGSLSGLAANSYVISVAPGSSITGTGVGAFDATTTVTATDATWSIPTLASSIVKVTVIGGGGGGGGITSGGNGGNGGQSSVAGSGLSTVTAAGGTGGQGAADGLSGTVYIGRTGGNGFFSNNGGGGGERASGTADRNRTGEFGQGGAITVAYLDLTGLSTLDITVGAGGSAGASDGGPGGSGLVIVEYVAG